MSDWVQIRIAYRTKLAAAYALADSHGCQSAHHFAEPWGLILRLRCKRSKVLIRKVAKAGIGKAWIDNDCVSADIATYGEAWPAVLAYFAASSRLAVAEPGNPAWTHRKLVHCSLNQWGYEVKDEARFARRFGRGRRKMLRHDLWWRLFAFGRVECKYGCHQNWPLR